MCLMRPIDCEGRLGQQKLMAILQRYSMNPMHCSWYRMITFIDSDYHNRMQKRNSHQAEKYYSILQVNIQAKSGDRL